MRLQRFVLALLVFLTACQPAIAPVVMAAATAAPLPSASASASPSALPSFTPTSSETQLPIPTPEPSATYTPSPTPLPAALDLDPADWEAWPVLPIVTDRARQIFQAGLSLGTDPHAFSVFGDCQSEPDVFLGAFETDPALVANLPPDLQETVAWFGGSFNRLSPTVKGGTTAGALMYSLWHENKYTCTSYETPIQCELRLHKPAIVIIRVGTHYESRNEVYMRKVLDQLMAAGVLPILATKADNSELDQHVNAGYASLAVEYALPFWNFWAALGELPKRGLFTRPFRENQGDIYLNNAAVEIQRMSALQMLDRVRRAVMGQ
jgi:hypothetical protein